MCAVLWATFCHGLFTWCTLLLRWTCLLNVGNVSWSYQLCLKATSRESPSPPPGHVITAGLEVEVTAVEFSPRFIAISYSISSSCGGIKKAYRGTMQIVLASHGGVTFQKCEINLYGSIRLKPPLACHCSNTPPSLPTFFFSHSPRPKLLRICPYVFREFNYMVLCGGIWLEQWGAGESCCLELSLRS